MLRKNHIIILSLVFATTLGILITSCDIKNPTEGLEVRLKTLTRTSQINVRFLDGATGEDVEGNVNITFEGQNKSDVISESNQPISSLTATDGAIIFALKDGLIPTEDNPAVVTVVAKANGYINTSKRLVIRQPINNFDITMTNVTNTPVGVTSTQQTAGNISDANSGVSTDVVVRTETPAQGGGSAAVVIPAGTTLLDGNGNALSGDVTTRVTYYNPNQDQSVQSFPGGLNGIAVQNQDGSEQDNVNFITAGFVSIDMEVNGTPVEQFGGEGINIEIDVPAGTYNPAEEREVQVGDLIPLWSYDEDNGEWTEEGLGEVKNITASGLLKSTASKVVKLNNIKHLSYWNLDWMDFWNTCTYGKTVVFDGCFDQMYIKLKNSSTGEYLLNYGQWIYGSSELDRQIKFYYAPSNFDVIVEFFADYYATQKLGEANIGNLCDAGDFHVDVTPFTSFQNISVRLIARCTTSDPERVVYPEGKTIWYMKQSGESWINAGQIDAEGYINLCLEEGVKYWFRSYIDGAYYYSYDYDDAPEMIEPGKTEYLFEIINPDVGDFCD